MTVLSPDNASLKKQLKNSGRSNERMSFVLLVLLQFHARAIQAQNRRCVILFRQFYPVCQRINHATFLKLSRFFVQIKRNSMCMITFQRQLEQSCAGSAEKLLDGLRRRHSIADFAISFLPETGCCDRPPAISLGVFEARLDIFRKYVVDPVNDCDIRA